MACIHRTVLFHDGDEGAGDVHRVRLAEVARRQEQPLLGELLPALKHEVVVLADLLDAK